MHDECLCVHVLLHCILLQHVILLNQLCMMNKGICVCSIVMCLVISILFSVILSCTCSCDGYKACMGTVDYGLNYDANQIINLEGYVDSDWESSAIDRKSTSGCCFSMGSGVISWFSKKKSCVALSTTEAVWIKEAIV